MERGELARMFMYVRLDSVLGWYVTGFRRMNGLAAVHRAPYLRPESTAYCNITTKECKVNFPYFDTAVIPQGTRTS